MHKEIILRSAKEAVAEFGKLPMMDAIVFSVDDKEWNSQALERFAAIIIDATIKASQDYKLGYADGVFAEREECAKVAENRFLDKTSCTAEEMYELQKKSIAADIRARKNT